MEEEEVEAVTNLNRWEFFPSPSFLLLLLFFFSSKLCCMFSMFTVQQKISEAESNSKKKRFSKIKN